MSIIDNLITDRTQSDVDGLRELLARGKANWTAEELAEFNLARSNGSYNYTDLNRVTEAMDYLNERLARYGYQTGYQKVEVPHQDTAVMDENTILLLHGDDLNDSSIYKQQISNTGVSISEKESKFGGKSFYFNGSSSYLTVNSDLFNFGSGDFTFDWWEYCVENSATRFSLSINGGCGGICAGGSHNTNSLYISSNGSSWDVISGAVTFSNTMNTWVHWAVVRNGASLKTYRNGSLFWSGTINGSVYWNGTGLVIGSFLYDTSHYFGGYIDEFRVSKVARWTEDFSPPSEPYDIVIGGTPVEELDPYTWYESDIPTVSLMTAYLSNVEAIRSTLEVLATTPETPESMEALTWVEANNIEQILVDVQTIINRVANGMARSNSFTFWSGNRPFPTAESNLGRTWAELDAMNTGWENWQVATWYLLLYGNLKAEGVVS